MTAHVVRGDALHLPLPDNSVDLVVTSPPYFGLRSYQDAGEHYTGQLGSEATPAEFVDALIAATREMVRVVKPSGSIWVNLGDKYMATSFAPHKRGKDASGVLRTTVTAACERCGQEFTGGIGRRFCSTFCGGSDNSPKSKRGGIREKSLIGIPWRYALRCIDDLGLILRAEVIWSKPNGLPESVTDRVRRSHEQWFHFTLSPRYFSAVDEIREGTRLDRPRSEWNAQDWQRYNNHAAGRITTQDSYTAAMDGERRKGSRAHPSEGGPGNSAFVYHPLGKLPGSVWVVPTEPLHVPVHVGVDHFAAFPTEWPRRIIAGWSPPAGTVLDGFGGTGTTALVAKALGRTGISLDMSADYCRLADWRTNDPDSIAKAARVDKAPREVDGQLGFDLFGEATA